MNTVVLSKRELCVAFIEHGKHISTAKNYIKSKYSLSEANLTCVIVKVQKELLPHFKYRWNASQRHKERFFADNELWLNGEVVVQLDESEEPGPSTGSKRGRPCKSFEESSEKTKKRKATQLFREKGLDTLQFSYVQGLRSIGAGNEAAIIELIRSASSEMQESVLQKLKQETDSVIPYTPDEALAIFIDLDLSRNQYQYLLHCLDEKACKVFPTYKKLAEAKTACYPSISSIEITDILAKVKMQALLDHTVERILNINSINRTSSNELILYSKWGCDGSSGQSEYKQILSGEGEFISDANLLISSLVPLKLVEKGTKELIWQNPTPSSVRFCRPILIEFSKETVENTRRVIHEVEEQIHSLKPSAISREGKEISVTHELFLTMIDGKVLQVLTDTPSSSTCPICLATPKQMNDLELVTQRVEREDTFKFGLSTLHAWIRCMELILHISYNLSFQKWSATTEEHKRAKQIKKQSVQERFRTELGLIIDKPRQVSGNSNDGNTARRFFANSACTSAITGIDEELIKRFHILLQTMACGKPINAKKFGEYAFKTAEIYVSKYKWYYMPSSVHKILLHGANIIRFNAILPLGQLSEDAQESRNKNYKQYRLHHARKCSRSAANEDVFHTLLYTSDPYVSSLRMSSARRVIELDEEALELLE